MRSIDLIRDNLKKSRDRVLLHVEEMKEQSVVFPTPRGGCHTEWEPLFDGPDPSGDVNEYPPFDQVLAKCREVRESTIALLESFTEDDLDKGSANAPQGWADTFGTYRLCLQYVADHWYMHRGHLADARRAAGVKRMWV